MSRRTVETWLLAACDPQTAAAAPTARLSLRQLPALLVAARNHAVAGAVFESLRRWRWLESLSVEECAAAGQEFEAARRLHAVAIGKSLGLKCVAQQAIVALARAGIPSTILKGEDFAARLYPSPALRPCRDVDLLVPQEAYADADRVIQSLGYAAVEGERKYAADDYGQISYFSTSAERWSLELHWNVINSPAQRRQCSLSWNDMEFLPPQSDGPRLLTPNSLLILAAVHACVGHRFDSLQQLCDIRQICRGAAGPIDAARLPAACVRLRCVTAMSWSLDLVARMFACAEARKLLSDETFAAAARGGAWSTIKPQTVLRPQTLGSRLRRSLARKRLKTAA